jgi:hypothetical protein
MAFRAAQGPTFTSERIVLVSGIEITGGWLPLSRTTTRAISGRRHDATARNTSSGLSNVTIPASSVNR